MPAFGNTPLVAEIRGRRSAAVKIDWVPCTTCGLRGQTLPGFQPGNPRPPAAGPFDEGPKKAVWHNFEAANKWYCAVRSPAAVGLQFMGAGGDIWEPGKAEPGQGRMLSGRDQSRELDQVYGLQVMRLDIIGNGPMNINYVDLARLDGVSLGEPPLRAPVRSGPGIRSVVRLPDGRLRLSLEGPGVWVFSRVKPKLPR